MRPRAFLFLLLLLSAPPPVPAQQAGPDLDGPLTENPKYNQERKGQAAESAAPLDGGPKAGEAGTRGQPANAAPPRSDLGPSRSSPASGESSSVQTRKELLPDDETSEVAEAPAPKPWNPIRALKCIDIGTFYYKKGNYSAAISRYREALEYKPRDAVATFRLAQALEKNKESGEARLRYQEYLDILKDGPEAAEARKALDRLGRK